MIRAATMALALTVSVGCKAKPPEPAPPAAYCPASKAIQVATWNLEWLNRRSDHGIVKRADEDYRRLGRYAGRLNAEVIAFQEVDGPEAAERVFDPKEWRIHTTRQKSPQRAGFAVRRAVPFTANPDVESLDVGGLRTGADITVTACGQRLRLLSVHLKSGCFDDPLDRPNKACSRLRQQLGPLEDWIDARAREDVPFAVLGDFNRRFGRTDTFWPEIDDSDPPNADLTDAGAGRTSPCWNAKYPEFIDHIVLDKRARRWFRPESFDVMTFDPADAPHKRVLSDHCPLKLTLELERGAP